MLICEHSLNCWLYDRIYLRVGIYTPFTQIPPRRVCFTNAGLSNTFMEGGKNVSIYFLLFWWTVDFLNQYRNSLLGFCCFPKILLKEWNTNGHWSKPITFRYCNEAQASLCKCADSTEPLLPAHDIFILIALPSDYAFANVQTHQSLSCWCE